jgi:2,3-dihydroxybenzoate decarboxylase
MKKIAIEEHFLTEEYIDYLRSRKEYPRLEIVQGENNQERWRLWNSADQYTMWVPRAIRRLCDIGEGRVKDMDDAGIDMQVLSFPSGIDKLDASEGTAMAKKVNDELSRAVKNYPKRFAGFAALAPKDPGGAADELERAVKQLGLKGAMVLSHVGGEYLDDRKYWVIFERAERLGVPIYVHPAHPSPERQKQYSGYPELAGSLWGFCAEGGLTAMRLICSGIFDEYPGLKIILGHLGEALPFWMWRLDNRWLHSSVTLMSTREPEKKTEASPLAKRLKKLPSQYIRENFFVTTSGMSWQPAFLCAYLALGADRILFAVDHPMEPSKEAVQFMDSMQISDHDKEKIYHLNAERLLGL